MFNRRPRMLFFVALLLTAAASVFAAAPEQDLEVTYTPADQTITGTLSLRIPDAEGPVYFVLYPNLNRDPNPYLSPRGMDAMYPYGFEASGLDVARVAVMSDGAWTDLPIRLLRLPDTVQTYSLDDTVLAVDLPASGGPVNLRIEFVTLVPRTTAGDDGLTDEILTWRFGWHPTLLEPQGVLEEVDGVLRYAEIDSFPIVFPRLLHRATVTVPASLQVLAGADRIDSSEPEDEDVEDAETVYTLANDAPTRSLGLTIAEGYERYTLDGTPAILVATRAGHAEAARLYATYVRDILAEYTARFGPYPHARLVLVENPNARGAAFAADGIIWLPAQLFTHRDLPLPGFLNRLSEFIIAHEIAHQWFGLGEGVDLDADAWLSEGLAQYASISYFESTHGAVGGNMFDVTGQGLVEDYIDRQFGFFNLREHQVELPYLVSVWSAFDEALVKPLKDVRFANQNAVRLYDKGYLIARTLAAVVGTETFDSVLAASAAGAADGRWTVDGLRQALDEASGMSLAAFFDAWIYGDATIDVSVTIASRTETDATHETVAVVRRNGGTPLPVVVEATMASGATTRQTWDAVAEEDTVVFRTPSYVKRISLDPDHVIPDINRLNNNAPTKIVGSVDRAALPLDAYLISSNATSGGFSFSYVDRFRIDVTPPTASMTVRHGRHHVTSAEVSVADARLTGNLSYSYVAYAQPETGSPGTYWEQASVYTLSVERLYSEDDPVLVLRGRRTDLPSLTTSRTRSFGVNLVEQRAVQLSASAMDELRLAPSFYVQGAVQFGFTVGDLPSELRFGFPELPATPLDPAENKLSGLIAIELPPDDAEAFSLLGLLAIDETTTRIFTGGGLRWTEIGDFGKTSYSVEAGIEQVFRLSTLGGLLSLTARTGASVPLVGGGSTVFYVELSL